ncbi:MAG: PH domain-containing protein [Polaribacter sp.]|nr:PH domain-containing protein [Polaribacter sp.]
MNSAFNFSEFSKQSSKGIFVIYISLIYSTLKISWIFIFLIFKDFSEISNTKLLYISLGIGIILLFLWIRAILIYKNFQFKITNNHFILKQGILKKSNTSIPFDKIQNINFKQNIIQQIINVYEVSIETAGSTKTEIDIKALPFLKATALKELILSNKVFEKAEKEKEVQKPLLKVDILSLFKVSLTENHLQNLFLFFAVLFGFYNQIQQITDGLGKTESLDGFIEENTNNFSASIFLISILIIGFTIIALLSSFVRVFLLHFNLTTYLKKDAFEINQGLFTKKSIVLKKQKVQNITISTNPLKRLIGISFITFKQAVSGKLNNKKKDKLIRIVGCEKHQIETVKSSLFHFSKVENSAINFSDDYYKRRIFMFSFLFLTVLYTGLYFIFSHIEIFYSLLLIIPIAVFLILKKVKKRFYKISEDMLLVGRGLLETHLIYLEIFKVQNIEMKQTIFQKRSKVADIILQTASGKIKIPCIHYKEALKIYNHTLYKVETSTAPWM